MLTCKGKKYILSTTGIKIIKNNLNWEKYVSIYKKFNMHIPLLEVNSKDIIMKVSKDMLKLETS